MTTAGHLHLPFEDDTSSPPTPPPGGPGPQSTRTSTRGRRKALHFRAPPGTAVPINALMGFVLWGSLGPAFSYILTQGDEVIYFALGRESSALFGITFATIGTVGVFIGTRSFASTNTDYKLAINLMAVIMVLEWALFAITADITLNMLISEPHNLLAPALIMTLAISVSFFAELQTAHWDTLTDVHIRSRIYSARRALSGLERPYTRDTHRLSGNSGRAAMAIGSVAWLLAPTSTLWILIWSGSWTFGERTVLAFASLLVALGISVAASGAVLAQASTPQRRLPLVRVATTGVLLLAIVIEVSLLWLFKAWSTFQLRDTFTLFAAMVFGAYVLLSSLALFDYPFALKALGLLPRCREVNSAARMHYQESIDNMEAQRIPSTS